MQARLRRLNLAQVANRLALAQLQAEIYRCLLEKSSPAAGGGRLLFLRRVPTVTQEGPPLSLAAFNIFAEDETPEVAPRLAESARVSSERASFCSDHAHVPGTHVPGTQAFRSVRAHPRYPYAPAYPEAPRAPSIATYSLPCAHPAGVAQ